MLTPDHSPITAPIPEFCKLSGLGRTSVYEMMDSGTLQYIKRGKRTLIVVASWQRYVDRQLREGVPPDHSTDAARATRLVNRAAAAGLDPEIIELAAKAKKRKERRQELAAGIDLGELGLQ